MGGWFLRKEREKKKYEVKADTESTEWPASHGWMTMVNKND